MTGMRLLSIWIALAMLAAVTTIPLVDTAVSADAPTTVPIVPVKPAAAATPAPQTPVPVQLVSATAAMPVRDPNVVTLAVISSITTIVGLITPLLLVWLNRKQSAKSDEILKVTNVIHAFANSATRVLLEDAVKDKRRIAAQSRSKEDKKELAMAIQKVADHKAGQSLADAQKNQPVTPNPEAKA